MRRDRDATVSLLVATSGARLAATIGAAVPCPHGQPVGPRVACTGPVVHHSSGAGGVLTIVLSVVVGLAIAVAGFLLARRRLAADAAGPRPPTRTHPRRS